VLAFVLAVGPTAFILNGFVDSLGRYLVSLPELSFNVDVAADGDWQMDWTLFYWGWWISWSPFVGLFIARISYGRTLREFVSGVLLVPTLVTFVVLSVRSWTRSRIRAS
jgi:choline/glycine/proline betaine transport protein